ncbi:MAG: hypothetical protein GXZ09_02565 [Syntrophomonadaceae bacterium]|jgi:hypothetical protein|nr:hypothetical protein [Syntrophomonadaceae bacterium]
MSTHHVENIPAIIGKMVRLEQQLGAAYPGIKLRWARIYGRRWSHLLGEVHDPTAVPMKLQINNEYGVIIEKHEILAMEDVENIVGLLKGEFGE